MRKKNLIKKLKPFWKKYNKIRDDYLLKILELEVEMNKKFKRYKLPQIGFFQVESTIVGIGAVDISERKKFDLIHGTELI